MKKYVNSHRIAILLGRKDSVLRNETIKPLIKQDANLHYNNFIESSSYNRDTKRVIMTYMVTKEGCLAIAGKLKPPHKDKIVRAIDKWFD